MRGVTSSECFASSVAILSLTLILTTIGCGEMAAPIPAAEAPPYTYETEGTGTGSDDGSVSSRKTAEPSGPSEPGLPAQDGGNGNDTDANPNPVPETCTAGTVTTARLRTWDATGPIEYDLYYCPGGPGEVASIRARYGDEPSEEHSIPVGASGEHYRNIEALWQARREARIRGHLKE